MWTTSWVNIKIGNHDQCSAHFYTIEMHWWVETLHKVPTRHGHRSYPLISIHYSKSSDWAGHRCVSPSTLIVWRSTKVTLIDSDHCHSVAQHYRTTNYSLPIIPFYTARTFHSWWLRSPSNLANYSLYSIETLRTSAKLILHSSIKTISMPSTVQFITFMNFLYSTEIARSKLYKPLYTTNCYL